MYSTGGAVENWNQAGTGAIMSWKAMRDQILGKNGLGAMAALLLVIAGLVSGCQLGGGLPPAVSYTNPAGGTATFPLAGPITAVFTRPMDSSSITTASFLVYNGSAPVTGTVTYSGNTAAFQPASTLPAGAAITAIITAAAKDTSGSPMAANYTWTFTTGLTVVPQLLFYTATFIPAPFSRYGGPVTFTSGGNTLSQTVNPDGTITLAITASPGSEDNGFYFKVGTLSSLNSLAATLGAGSGTVSVNLWLDINNDGDFFAWNGNAISGLGGDQSLVGPASSGTSLVVSSTSTFSGYTLAQLKGGSLAGVNGNTGAAIWIGVAVTSGSLTATITGIQQQ